MKKLKAFGLLVLVLALSLAFIACDNATGGGTGGSGGDGGTIVGATPGRGGGGGGGYTPTTPTARVLTFTSGEGANKVEIKITQKLSSSRAAYQPKSGDSYEIKVGGKVISSGTVTVTEDADTLGKFYYKFVPDSTKATVAFFTAIFESGELVFDAAITPDNGGTPITIPPLQAVGYEEGVADSDPIDNATKKTIAGMAYSRKETISVIWNTKVTHYLISGNYEDAYDILSAPGVWGEPDVTSDTPNVSVGIEGYTDISEGIRKDELTGVLFEVYYSSTPDSDGEYSNIDNKLAVWVGDSTSGTWKIAIWKGEKNLTETEATKTIIGGLTYTQKEPYTTGPDKVECTNYVLTISYDAALTKLRELWGAPIPGWEIYDYRTLTESDSVVFNKVKKTYSDNTTAGDFCLVKYDEDSENWLGVGWFRSQN